MFKKKMLIETASGNYIVSGNMHTPKFEGISCVASLIGKLQLSITSCAGAQKRKFLGGGAERQFRGLGPWLGPQENFSNMAPNKSISDFGGAPGLPGMDARPFLDARGACAPAPPPFSAPLEVVRPHINVRRH